MRKFMLATAAIIGLTVSANAADMALKAAPPVPFSPAADGWYVGLGTEGGVAASSVSGNAFPSLTSGNLTADGGAIVVDAGYIWGNCFLQSWCQIEGDVKYQNISGTGLGGSINSKWALSQEFDIGVDVLQGLQSVLNLNTSVFPTFNPTGLLPSNIAVATTPRGYVGFIAQEMEIGGSFGAAHGQTWVAAFGPTAGFRWQTLNATGKPNGGSLKVYATILAASHGVTFDNIFGAGGAPMVVNASGRMNDLYLAGVHYDFGIPSR